MGEPHVVSALRDKRNELAGMVAKLERELTQCRSDLGHVDAALRLFAPELTPPTIRPKAIRNRDAIFQNGELPRLVLDHLRTANGAVHVNDIARFIMPAKGMDPKDPRAMDDMTKRLGKCLARLKASGVAVNEPGWSGKWMVAEWLRNARRVGKLVHNAVTRQTSDLVERVEDDRVTAWRVAG